MASDLFFAPCMAITEAVNVKAALMQLFGKTILIVLILKAVAFCGI